MSGRLVSFCIHIFLRFNYTWRYIQSQASVVFNVYISFRANKPREVICSIPKLDSRYAIWETGSSFLVRWIELFTGRCMECFLCIHIIRKHMMLLFRCAQIQAQQLSLILPALENAILPLSCVWCPDAESADGQRYPGSLSPGSHPGRRSGCWCARRRRDSAAAGLPEPRGHSGITWGPTWEGAQKQDHQGDDADRKWKASGA